MMNQWGARAGVLVAVAAGCSTLAGLDADYHLLSGQDAGQYAGQDAGCSGSSASTSSTGESGVAMLGECCAPAGALACLGHAQKSRLICGPDGTWGANGTCDEGALCDTTAGAEQGTCKPGLAACAGKTSDDVVCVGLDRVKCGVDLLGVETVESCSPDSQICVAGACVVPPSCMAPLPATCGPGGNESCCKFGAVPGGTYNRINDPLYPATVSDFRLDRIEITVGRFRAFVNAYPASKPKQGDGAHPLIPDSGWRSAWDGFLPPDKTALEAAVKCSAENQTWRGMPGANDNLPMNCINWFEAFAFCAWDGGRLPTEAEWNYAAAGGGEQRTYPWQGAILDPAHAVYDCKATAGGPMMMCSFADILKVGSKSQGDGKWGQADLAGNVWEWNLDAYVNPLSKPCIDCANKTPESFRVIRGGCWNCKPETVPNSWRDDLDPKSRAPVVGARCARSP